MLVSGCDCRAQRVEGAQERGELAWPVGGWAWVGGQHRVGNRPQPASPDAEDEPTLVDEIGAAPAVAGEERVGERGGQGVDGGHERAGGGSVSRRCPVVRVHRLAERADAPVVWCRLVPGRVTALQAAWLVALTVLLLAAAARQRRASLLAGGLAVAVAVPITTGPGTHRLPADPAAVELVCTSSGPQVCLSRINAFLIDSACGWRGCQPSSTCASYTPPLPARPASSLRLGLGRSSPPPRRHPG
ncbi:hypothetical protein EFE23_24685 [Micromonospora solifontis]|uniref:Uncharacterized protein n=1 Tax=Micromonospora solifontis TaxID=2487138 RepID=A0ABX9WBJ5_9ACTN|nr:hypothetical protein EFE23_24685 [Micromonospora solifontis]